MGSEIESRPQYLTLTEVLANVGLFAAIGYWVGGVKGAWAGAVLMLTRYVYLIWRAVKEQDSARAGQPQSVASAARGKHD